MKPKVHYQVQPRQTVPPLSEPVHVLQVQQEIENFLRALDSYPARAAKDPQVTFQQHMSSIFAAHDDDSNPRRRH
jgi:hypothetical protein